MVFQFECFFNIWKAPTKIRVQVFEAFSRSGWSYKAVLQGPHLCMPAVAQNLSLEAIQIWPWHIKKLGVIKSSTLSAVYLKLSLSSARYIRNSENYQKSPENHQYMICLWPKLPSWFFGWNQNKTHLTMLKPSRLSPPAGPWDGDLRRDEMNGDPRTIVTIRSQPQVTSNPQKKWDH